MPTTRRSAATLVLVLLAASALLVGCSPTSGPLGTPSTPAPTGQASVAPPSGDATPGPAASAVPTVTSAPAASSATATASPAAPATGPVGAAASGTIVLRAYFALSSSTGTSRLVPVLREIPTTVGVAAAALRQLIAGPNAMELGAQPGITSDVSPLTQVLGLSISAGVATVNLSSEFTLGGAAPASASAAQVVYTLTQFSTVNSVKIEIEGQPLSVPTTRAGYRDTLLPAIFVDRPAWGAAAGNPAAVTGVANVFEATFRAQIKGATGAVLADQQVMASCGTGCWGDFSTTLAYPVNHAQWGTLRVYDLSPRDGTPENVTEYPIWLAPAG
jgi:hypothetical protein